MISALPRGIMSAGVVVQGKQPDRRGAEIGAESERGESSAKKKKKESIKGTKCGSRPNCMPSPTTHRRFIDSTRGVPMTAPLVSSKLGPLGPPSLPCGMQPWNRLCPRFIASSRPPSWLPYEAPSRPENRTDSTIAITITIAKRPAAASLRSFLGSTPSKAG